MQLIVTTPAGKVCRQLCPVCALSLPSFFSPSPSARLLNKSCPDCGLTLRAFRECGKLGCASCYETFKLELHDIFMRAQGTDCHVPMEYVRQDKTGVPVPPGDKSETANMTSIVALRQALKEAVAREDYEEAAQLRDRIRKLERTE
jgi:protein arginine kinase activator